jgi:signal transduction histidine kinase
MTTAFEDLLDPAERDAAQPRGFDARREDTDVRRLAALGLMTSGIAHDIGNLLQVVTCAIHLIDQNADATANAEVHALARGAMAAVDRASLLGREILRYSRSQGAACEITEIGATLAACRTLICWAAGPATLVEFVLGEDVPPVICNARELENAVLNLVINAREAMPEGGRLTLSTHREEVGSGSRGKSTSEVAMAVLRVTDSGGGMTPETASRAFRPFFSTKPPGRSAGLGLAIVSDFIKRLGGSIDIESASGGGASIVLRFPGCGGPLRP